MVFPWWGYGVFTVWFVGVGLSTVSGSKDGTRERERKARQWRKRNDLKMTLLMNSASRF